jgi:hypothetical protein
MNSAYTRNRGCVQEFPLALLKIAKISRFSICLIPERQMNGPFSQHSALPD